MPCTDLEARQGSRAKQRKEIVMSVFVNRICGWVVGVGLLAAAAAAPLSAQQLHFHLPVAAKWAGTVLPVGDYRLRTMANPTGMMILTIQGPAGARFLVPMTTEAYGARKDPPAQSYLQLVEVDGKYFVNKLEASTQALTYFFKVPEPSRQLQMSAQVSTNIPVTE